MLNTKKILAVIPARGGIKRLHKKNILPLNGKPLIAWTIQAAKNSQYIDEFIVSTDDDEISRISIEYGSKVLIRPGELSTDIATSIDVILHAINSIREQYDYIMLLQPTSPLRNNKDIDNAIELITKKDAKAVISVCESDHSPLWSNTLPEDGSMDDFIREEVKSKRSQDLPSYYRLNGAIYMAEIEGLRKEKTFFLKRKTHAYIMKRENSIDIDEPLDFKIAELLSGGEK